jgi:formiminotetrahydrofolate cyclodeaminase
MVGTLTTAGTGNLNAISETARAIQLAQLVLDFVLIVVALSLFVLRISEYRYQKQMERP